VAKDQVVEFVLENSLYEEQGTILGGVIDHLLHEIWVIDHFEPAILGDADTSGGNLGRRPLIDATAESREERLVCEETKGHVVEVEAGLCGSGHVDSERAEVPGYIYSLVDLGRQVNKNVVKGMSTALTLFDMFESSHDLAMTRRLLLIQFTDPALHPHTVAVGRGREVGKLLLKLPSLLRTALVARHEGSNCVYEDFYGD